MNISKEQLKVYGVTDRRWLANTQRLDDMVQEAIQGGLTCVQVREKKCDIQEFIHLAMQIKQVTTQYHVPLIINDSLEVFLAVDGDGIHIGQEDCSCEEIRAQIGKNKILGVSVQTVEQAVQAQQQGADYLGVGAMFSTTTKEDAADVSIEELKQIVQAVTIPVVAIGGIDSNNMDQLTGTGIAGVAVISAIFAQIDCKKAAAMLAEKVNCL